MTHPYTRLYRSLIAPTVSDDDTLGYEIGDIFIDQVAQQSYQAMDVSTGAAVWVEITGGGGSGAWGAITGTLSDQTDLQAALNGKLDDSQLEDALNNGEITKAPTQNAVFDALAVVVAATQPLDSDLTAIAALAPADNDIIQRKAGAWTFRTIAQYITDLGLGAFAFISSLAHSSLTGIGANDHHAQDHAHNATDAQKLIQANSHQSPDTDVGTTSLHHTLGAGANQSAAGNHAHSGMGDVVGPASSIDAHLVAFDGTTGKILKTAGVTKIQLHSLFADITDGVSNGNTHDHVGGDGAPLDYSYVIGAFLSNVAIPASTLWYSCPFKPTIDFNTNSFPWPEAGVLSNLLFRTQGQPATGTTVITLYVNGVATALTVTIPAGSGIISVEDTTHTVTISAGDTLRWNMQNNATSATSPQTAVSMKLTRQTT